MSFGLLIGLYKGEGCLHEALAVADRAVQFGQGTEEREELVAHCRGGERDEWGDLLSVESFGSRALALTDAGTLVQFEIAKGKAELFSDVDALVTDVVVRLLRAERVVTLYGDPPKVAIHGLAPRNEATLEGTYAVASQHTRGAWFLPEQVRLKVGFDALPWAFSRIPSIRDGGRIGGWAQRVQLVDSAAAVFVWAVSEPLFEQLAIPFELRGHLVGTKPPEEQLAAWANFDELIAALGFSLDDELAVMRYGGGWGQLAAPGQLEAKRCLLAAMGAQAGVQLAPRYRAYRLLPLIARYYEKAKNGQARRKQVVTRALEPTLAGFFGGDWLRFLDYLGETPHPKEEIVTAIPETRLFVTGADVQPTEAAEGLRLSLRQHHPSKNASPS